MGTAGRKNDFHAQNAPSGAARVTNEYLNSPFRENSEIIYWQSCSPVLNPIKNL